MATPTIPERRLMAAGLKKGSAWGTAVALGAGFGVLIEGDGGLNRSQPYIPANEADTPMALDGDLGQIDPVSFSIPFTWRHALSGLGISVASFFGTAGSPAALSNGYRHTFQWADEIYGNFITFAVEKLSKIWEVASAKPTALDLNIADGLFKGSLSFLGNTVIDNSAVNTSTQMDALTYANRATRAKFSTIQVKMNNQSAGDAYAETALEVSDLAIHYERPHDSPHKAGTSSIIEPAGNAHPIITIDLNFPRMNTTNNAYFTTDFIGEVEKKIVINIIGNLLGGAVYYETNLYFPRLRVVETEYTWDEVIPARIKLQAEEASANPTGMSYARPYLTMINDRSTDYLA
ncbi:hypothetical protein CMI37_30985 [Candidatus Pacearchaeota archaeon]|nr:hypothetical protein [Candidatus Pacearchaeota archaeon]|tara:strand:- start:3615 stop:4658 length:1044 start_codon:yes stop_codon:yes gene_type:complete